MATSSKNVRPFEVTMIHLQRAKDVADFAYERLKLLRRLLGKLEEVRQEALIQVRRREYIMNFRDCEFYDEEGDPVA